MSFANHIHSLLDYIPSSNRPDVSSVIEYAAKRILQDRILEKEGRKALVYCNVPTLNWMTHNWTPRVNDIILASFPKTGQIVLLV